ncbi:MAG: hypothetical protein JW809_01375 [Pirellulales bacterium]|nr:hypothetical protein [Pirellulales bacterium]
MIRLSFYPVGDSYLLVVVVAAGLLLLWALVRSGRVTGRGRRASLAALRLAAMGLIVLALLRPTLVTVERQRQAATLAVLCDASRSMSVPDASGGRKTRYEAMRQCLEDAREELSLLARDFEVRPYAFDATARLVELTDGRIALPEKPEGRETAMGLSLEDVLREEAGKRVLGIVLLGDGAQRAYAPRDLAPQTAAAGMKRLGQPLFTVGFGQALGLGEAKDVAIKQLLVDSTVFVKNDLPVEAQIRVDGFVNREIPVRLWFETSPGKMERVAQEVIKPAADGQLLPVRFHYTPQTPGQFKLALDVPEQPGELATTNNRQSTFVTVRAGGLNVLYIEGFPPRVDTKYLRRALDASPDVDVDFVSLSARSRPGDLADRLKPGRYAVIVLGDVDASLFTPDELRSMAEAVSRGAGLVMLGGYQSFGPGGYAETPLADVLPVQMTRFERQKPDDPIRPDMHWPGPIQMRPSRYGSTHFAMRLAADRQKSQELWGKLPPLDGANRFDKLKPGALVLATDQRDRPLLVQQSFGAGRAMAFGGDTTWRWRMHGFEDEHARFWRQMILWLARKDEAAEGNVWVKLARRRIGPGERLEFTAGAQSATGDAVEDATLDAEAVLPEGTARPLRLTRRGSSWHGSFGDTRLAGDYAIRVTARQGQTPLGAAQARFLVFEQDLELDNASADVSALESLAAMTDGESIAPEELSGLLARLRGGTESLEEQTEVKRTLWDSWPLFLLLVALWTAEWYLRKRWGLV